MGMLYDSASIDNTRGARTHQGGRTRQDLFVARAPAAAWQDWFAGSDLPDQVMILLGLAWVRFEDIRPQLHRLAHQGQDLAEIAIAHAAPRPLVRLRHQRLNPDAPRVWSRPG